ncbi:cysteine hydrolase family protein [Alicyclobacillus sp. ALC3]|uniref:cysteine hydrolase family protein n=1 Tax=Alicyclobacillus sp. ALC3 TaxID=2796143 RepID=UPI002378A749|nr:isochorismatase family cysteine hydrolase [Alicyclobacillus sp. ALC3]WDL97703.1 cysteine hydrolase [Alicyclobacillus sp. ALC3]
MATTALIIVDIQDDFCAVDGAYARGGLDIGATRAILPTVDRAIQGAKAAGLPQIASLFTVFENENGEALLAPHLANTRPFLRDYGFRVGDCGRLFSREVTAPSHQITKPRHSAFYCTPLEILLRDMSIHRVVICGITANGGVASTVRDAYLRDLEIVVLSDAVAAFSDELKYRALADMGEIASVRSTDEWLATL